MLRIVMGGKRLFSAMSGVSNAVEATDYSSWTKKQLLKRIMELEGRFEEIESGVVPVASAPQPAKDLDFSKYHSRKIALRFSYLGWNYQGLAVQKEDTAMPTVEFEILKALHKTRLIKTLSPNDCDFSRCGRTDKGVSAMNQVISLKVRSLLTAEEQADPANDSRELDYVNILNKIVPDDIQFHAICLRLPEDFDARFSCTGRHYKYIFDGKGLDIDLMRRAARKYVGTHDFRNFCKLDGGKQMTNFVRGVFSADILPLEGHEGMYIFDLKGKAFLWHQVRCMVVILFRIGQGLENESVIDFLLDVEKCPRKPLYTMAHDIPLVLHDCQFPDNIDWTYAGNDTKGAKSGSRLQALNLDYKLKSIISDMQTDISIKFPLRPVPGVVCENLGDGLGSFMKRYIPLNKRETGKSFEELNEAWRDKKQEKRQKLE